VRVFHSLGEARGLFGPSAITIGNFDGVHAGHRSLMRHVQALGQSLDAKPSVVTFEPHPTRVVAPERAPKLLTGHDERADLLRVQGVDQLMILPFDEALSRMTPEEFFHDVLLRALGARAITVGENFRFGRKQSGGTETLLQLGREAGVRIDILPALRLRGVTVSSSEVRRLLAAGNVSKAARLLERPYALQGSVVPGEGRGRTQTVPTLNLDTHSIDNVWQALPANGVYITRTTDAEEGCSWPSITNTGYRPTFGGQHLTIETFLLPPLDANPPRRIRVEFLRRVREERQFPGAAELKQQILRDVGRAQAYFRRTRSIALRPA
jgi:riboflavin kinase/FMN adenylyltransferase